MIKSKYITTVVVVVEHDRPIAQRIVDEAAQRVHTIDGVHAATSTLIGTVEQSDAGKFIRQAYEKLTDTQG
jgi:hypothetical protein